MIGIIFSVITSITAIIALIQANRQMKLSNKQQLFDRRLKVYMTVHGLLELYRQIDTYLKWIKRMKYNEL